MRAPTPLFVVFFARHRLPSNAVTAPGPSAAPFPPPLSNLTLDGARQLYQRLVVHAGASEIDSLSGTAASRWDSLSQRLRFVVPLFRSRHADRRLHCRPLSSENVEQMLQGQVPDEGSMCLGDCCPFE